MQEVLRNSNSPGTSQSSQVVEHEEPQILGMPAPQQVNVKHNIATPNPAGGEAMSSFFMEPFNVFENAVKTPLPTLTEADYTWAPIISTALMPFIRSHCHLGTSGVKDFMSGVPDALRFDSVVGPHMNVWLRPYTDQQECQITLEIGTRITITATQNLLPNVSNQVCLLLPLVELLCPPLSRSVC